MGAMEVSAMDAQDKEIYTRVVDTVVGMAAAMAKLTGAVDDLVTAVTALTHEVSRLERRAHEQPAE